jgi:pyruvyl transferase EpsO
MATLLYPLQVTLEAARSRRNSTGTLCLLRNDCETAPALEHHELLGSCTWKGDWQELLGFRYWQLKSASLTADTLGWALPSKAFSEAWLRAARLAASHCMGAFVCYEQVVTSRLHGHILAALLGVPSVLLDNSYGKNAAYFGEWHGPLVTTGSAVLHLGTARGADETGPPARSATDPRPADRCTTIG